MLVTADFPSSAAITRCDSEEFCGFTTSVPRLAKSRLTFVSQLVLSWIPDILDVLTRWFMRI